MKNNKSQELDENDLLHQEDIDAILNQESHGTWGGRMTAEEFIAPQSCKLILNLTK